MNKAQGGPGGHPPLSIGTWRAWAGGIRNYRPKVHELLVLKGCSIPRQTVAGGVSGPRLLPARSRRAAATEEASRLIRLTRRTINTICFPSSLVPLPFVADRRGPSPLSGLGSAAYRIDATAASLPYRQRK